MLTCKLRNAKRERQVPEEVLDSMYERFRAPMIDEGFDLVEEVKKMFGQTIFNMGANKFISISTVSFIVFLREIFGTILNGLPVVFTNDEQLACKVKQLANYGSDYKYHHILHKVGTDEEVMAIVRYGFFHWQQLC